MSINQPAFRPASGGTVSLAVTAASSNVQVQTGNLNRHLRLFNAGTVTVFVEASDGSGVTAAATTGMPVPPGGVEIISSPLQYIAAVTAAGTSTLYCTPGEGL